MHLDKTGCHQWPAFYAAWETWRPALKYRELGMAFLKDTATCMLRLKLCTPTFPIRLLIASKCLLLSFATSFFELYPCGDSSQSHECRSLLVRVKIDSVRNSRAYYMCFHSCIYRGVLGIGAHSSRKKYVVTSASPNQERGVFPNAPAY